LINKNDQQVLSHSVHNFIKDDIYSILEDNQGNIWLGAISSGLSKYDPLLAQFNTTRISNSDSKYNKIWSIAELPNDVLIGMSGGLSRFNEESGIHHYPQFSDISVAAIEIQEDIIWLGTWDNGLIQWNTKTGEQRNYLTQSSDTTSLSSNRVRSITVDKKGRVWVGTPKGLNRYKPESNNFEHFQFHTTEGQNLKTNSIITIYSDRNGMLWLGTEGGLVCFRYEEEEVNIFRTDTSLNSLSHDFVRSIFQSKDGTMWVGTSGGLNKFSIDEMSFITYRMKDGLPSDVIYSIFLIKGMAYKGMSSMGMQHYEIIKVDYILEV